MRWRVFLAWLLLIPAVALTAFLGVAQNATVYGWIQDRYVDVESTGVSDADRYRLNGALAAYLRGEQAELDDRAVVYGEDQVAFHETERAHMVDVRNLFALARRCRWALLLGGALALAGPLWRGARLWPGFRAAMGVWAALLLAIAAWALADFDRAFTAFHRALFSNELWLMNPETDLMIRMLPEAFFAEIAVWCAAAMVAAVAVVGLGVWLLERNRMQKQAGVDAAEEPVRALGRNGENADEL